MLSTIPKRLAIISLRSITCRAIVHRGTSCLITLKPFYSRVISAPHVIYSQYLQTRFKYTKKEEDSSDSEDEVETVQDEGKDFKVLKIKVGSLRADLVLKAALGIARNKIEAAVYKSKVRVNGLKLLKKSSQLKSEDEVDLIKGTSKLNPEFLVVSRVKILSYTPKEEKYSVMVQCFRSLTIENYVNEPYKMSEGDHN
ncbi:hypothetical protein J437_LFUL001717 [Ladona fulva]|uniref:Mitochondrial transcription rescue factor 1 C-terminal domain-containing protein n=1 Tax=Ladona fulva TaxID=123851 RepID=A0A8K0JZQ9_LADFU|nr:hypothetical protein J437_LFUL001717 [Ladona fulva]